MKRKAKIQDLAVVILFLGALGVFCALSLAKPADELSYSERRRLQQFPQITAKTLFSAEAMSDINDAAVDQFIFREQFRSLKAVFDMNVLLKADNNAIFTIGDHVFKTEYPLRENSVKRLCNLTNYIYDTHLQGMRAMYMFIPDKNYYISDSRRHLVVDYDEMKAIIRGNTNAEIGEIEVFDLLSLASYYMTDAHWKQETIGSVADAVLGGFGNPARFSAEDYEQKSFFPFHGVYFGQSALNVKPDELTYLVSEVTNSASVTSVERPGETLAVYDEQQLGGMDSYNLFMHGPQALLRAENPLNPDGKELVIFRDSFASSLSPLLLPGYSAVTLVDLRYINPELVGQFIEFSDQDVLFMYSAGIFNNSDSMRLPAQQDFVSPFTARSAKR